MIGKLIASIAIASSVALSANHTRALDPLPQGGSTPMTVYDTQYYYQAICLTFVSHEQIPVNGDYYLCTVSYDPTTGNFDNDIDNELDYSVWANVYYYMQVNNVKTACVFYWDEVDTDLYCMNIYPFVLSGFYTSSYGEYDYTFYPFSYDVQLLSSSVPDDNQYYYHYCSFPGAETHTNLDTQHVFSVNNSYWIDNGSGNVLYRNNSSFDTSGFTVNEYRFFGGHDCFYYYGDPDDYVDISFQFGFTLLKNSNFNAGYQEGLDVGYTNGYTNGYDEGQTAGYNTGYTAGNSAGYDTGYQTGNAEGYQTGYQAGLDLSTHASFNSLMAAIADTPIRMLYSLFSFDLFGTSMLAVILSLLTGIIIFGIVKKFIL